MYIQVYIYTYVRTYAYACISCKIWVYLCVCGCDTHMYACKYVCTLLVIEVDICSEQLSNACIHMYVFSLLILYVNELEGTYISTYFRAVCIHNSCNSHCNSLCFVCSGILSEAHTYRVNLTFLNASFGSLQSQTCYYFIACL